VRFPALSAQGEAVVVAKVAITMQEFHESQQTVSAVNLREWRRDVLPGVRDERGVGPAVAPRVQLDRRELAGQDGDR
jgi:hypothetical protein